MVLLRRTLNARIGKTGLPPGFVVKLAVAAIAGAAVAWIVKLGLPPRTRSLPPLRYRGLMGWWTSA